MSGRRRSDRRDRRRRPSAPAGRTERDRRRRALGQNFLVDERVVSRLIDGLALAPGRVVVDIGAGTGALTLPLAAAGATVMAVEPDPVWADRLEASARRAGVDGRVRVVRADVRALDLPPRPFHVVASPPFGLTTTVLALLLDHPDRGPERADLILQREVVEKHAQVPPTTLRTAAWAPWWTFQAAQVIGRAAFRPRPAVDARVLVVRRRPDPVLPTRLSPQLRELLRPAWGAGGARTRRRRQR